MIICCKSINFNHYGPPGMIDYHYEAMGIYEIVTLVMVKRYEIKYNQRKEIV